MKKFETPTKIYMEVGPPWGMFKNVSHWGHNLIAAMVTPNVFLMPENSIFLLKNDVKIEKFKTLFLKSN